MLNEIYVLSPLLSSPPHPKHFKAYSIAIGSLAAPSISMNSTCFRNVRTFLSGCTASQLISTFTVVIILTLTPINFSISSL